MENAAQATPRHSKSPEGSRPSRSRLSPSRRLGILALAVGAALGVTSCGKPPKARQSNAAGTPCVGAEALHTIVLNRGDIVAAQPAENAPLVAQINSVQQIENQQFSYLVSYVGTEKGTFNLTDYLCTPSGERLRDPITPVQVDSYVPEAAEYAVRNLPVPDAPEPPPYTALLSCSTAVWLGLGLWMFFPRTIKRPTAPPTPPPPETAAERTLEDLLRPLVEKAAQKTISAEEKARMEQILFRYWGALLQLDHLNSVEQLRRILEHEEAGALLRTVEKWLYQPDSEIPAEEITLTLKPYMDLPITEHPSPLEEQPAHPEPQS